MKEEDQPRLMEENYIKPSNSYLKYGSHGCIWCCFKNETIIMSLKRMNLNIMINEIILEFLNPQEMMMERNNTIIEKVK